MMLVADVNIDGEVPVMCGTPVVPHSMTFDTWLDITSHRSKGFKLVFHSIEAVEVALHRMRRKRDQVNAVICMASTYFYLFYLLLLSV